MAVGQAVTLFGSDGEDIRSDNPLPVGGSSNTDSQFPLATDSDTVYVKDIDTTYSDIGDFSGSVTDLFDSLKSIITNETSDNPKSLKVWFKRTVYAHEIGIGCDDGTAGFGTDITVKLLGSAEAVRFTRNFTGLDTNSALLEFGPRAFNGFILEFNTASTVCISNVTIRKAIETSTILQALKPNGDVTNIDATTGGNLKVSVEELENQISVNGNSQLKTTQYSSDGTEIKVDLTTGSLTSVSYEHKEIHGGDHYNYCDYDISPLGSSDTIEFILTTPDTTKWTHFTFEVFSSTGATIELYEGASGISGGTSITPRNNNRNSSNTSGITIIKDPTGITSDGIRAAGFLAGANRVGGFVTRERENILKQNTIYLLRITSLASSNNISWCAEWYDHTNIS